jgi:uncharacterized cupredoxin-like copper-binding protein
MIKSRASRGRRLAAVAVSLALVGGLAACGDDDDADEATTPAEDLAPDDDEATDEDEADAEEMDEQAFCEAALAVGAPEEPDIDYETATDEEVRAAEEAFVVEEFQPHVEALAERGPEDVRDDAEQLLSLIEEAMDDPESDVGGALFTGEGGEARAAIVGQGASDCDWEQVEVSMVDFSFEGVPDTVEAGTVAFEASNDGDEMHEMVLFRKNEGVEQSIEELLEMPEEEAQGMVTFVSGAFAEPGDSTWAVAELEPGEYGMVCFVPVGTTTFEEEQEAEGEEGPPHFTQGMHAEFTVE